MDGFKDAFEEDDKKLLRRYAERDAITQGQVPSTAELLDMEEDYDVRYPTVFVDIAKKAELFKGNSSGYRQICALPRVALGLVMASRIRSHFTHASWFRISSLRDMVKVHGGVSASSPDRIPTRSR